MSKTNMLDHLTVQESYLVATKTLSILGNLDCSQMAEWPFEDLSLNDLFFQIEKIYSNVDLKKDFIEFCVSEIKTKNSYLIVEGFFRLLKLFESLERYEDCVILKDIKDSLLLDSG